MKDLQRDSWGSAAMSGKAQKKTLKDQRRDGKRTKTRKGELSVQEAKRQKYKKGRCGQTC